MEAGGILDHDGRNKRMNEAKLEESEEDSKRGWADDASIESERGKELAKKWRRIKSWSLRMGTRCKARKMVFDDNDDARN